MGKIEKGTRVQGSPHPPSSVGDPQFSINVRLKFYGYLKSSNSKEGQVAGGLKLQCSTVPRGDCRCLLHRVRKHQDSKHQNAVIICTPRKTTRSNRQYRNPALGQDLVTNN